MHDVQPPGWLKSWIVTSLASTVYASVGVSTGAVLFLIAERFGGQPWAWFFAGACIPPGLMALLDTSDWMFRRRLRNLKPLFDEDLVSREQYEEHRRRAMDWRADRLYGRPTASGTRPRSALCRRRPAVRVGL